MDPVSLILLFFLGTFLSVGRYVWVNIEELHRGALQALAEERRREAEEDDEEDEDTDSSPPLRSPAAKRKKARHLKVVPIKEDEAFSLDDTVEEAADPFTILEGDD